jgi:hypothetical protein
MTSANRKRACWITALLLGSAILGANADEALKYGPRANRYEGIRAKKVAGFGVELLSALVDYRDNPQEMGDRWHIRFYLKRPDDVNIVVRELDYKKYYWMDKVQPQSPWKAGFDNVFAWPTSEVVVPLDLRMPELGVVARLGADAPGSVEEVAPVVFYQSQFPTRVTAYEFQFKVRETSELTWTIYRQKGGTPVATRAYWRQTGGRPFRVGWDVTSPAVAEGAYTLVLSGYALSNNDPVSQIVKFYHRPLIH